MRTHNKNHRADPSLLAACTIFRTATVDASQVATCDASSLTLHSRNV